MLPEATTYEELFEQFQWNIPPQYNMGVDVCDKWAIREPDRLALTVVGEDGDTRDYSFGDLMRLSNRLANLLAQCGVNRSDRIGILLPQTAETAFSHIALHKMGAISIPLFMLFGVEALHYRLQDSGAKSVITNAEGAQKIAAIRDRLPALEHVFTVDGSHHGARDVHGEMVGQSPDYAPLATAPDDPALIIYTSGTTGQPKGALHGHRVLLGHLPGVEMSHDLFPCPGDKIWTPADWAWIGGLLDVLMPALHHGVPVVARRFSKFTGESAFDLMRNHGIRNAFLPPTALKMMRAVPNAENRWALRMRSIASGGETVGTELIEWGERVFGVTINEFYGQTECNMIVSSCNKVMAVRPGIMGRPVPGHELAIVSDEGVPLPDGKTGNIAVKRPDPVMFLEYWNAPEKTADKFRGDWMLTGDIGVRDPDGWIRYVGRDDDVITSAGYRIGPGEIEDCLIGHPAVKMAGVVGKPNPQRTEIVKAYIVLTDEAPAPTLELENEIKDWVKYRLAAHEYPREVTFVEDLPMTATGKIIRRALRKRARRELET